MVDALAPSRPRERRAAGLAGGFGDALATRRGLRVALVAALATLTGCSLFEDDERLEGERIRVRDRVATIATETVNTVPGQALPAPRRLDDWTQTGAVATHNGGHLAGPVTLSEAWQADIGDGSSSDGAITSAPVVAEGRIFALDAAAQVTALSATSGDEVWSTDLTPEGEDSENGFGGGLAWSDGRVFASTGFGEALALNADTGEILWRVSLGAPIRAAPAVDGDLLIAVARNNIAFGLSTADGAIQWRSQGLNSEAGVLGGASPAITRTGAILPFGSGEIVAVDRLTGQRFWGSVLSGGARGLARGQISDVTGDPVIIGGLVVAANQAGRLAAVQSSTGRRAWTRSIGAVGPIWGADSSLFLVTDTAQLVRLDTATGSTVWGAQLPRFEDEEDREDPITYSGPVLVQGGVLVTSSLGELLRFDAETGVPVDVVELGDGSITGPVVAGDFLYVLTDDGDIEAYR
ncbi:MAG: PQQ-binding-like beta-propeller repeat protein [Pseudomonadota bacterium]